MESYSGLALFSAQFYFDTLFILYMDLVGTSMISPHFPWFTLSKLADNWQTACRYSERVTVCERRGIQDAYIVTVSWNLLSTVWMPSVTWTKIQN